MSRLSGSLQQQTSRVYEQEVALNSIFDDLSESFKKIDQLNDSKKQSELKRMTAQMQEAKAYDSLAESHFGLYAVWTLFVFYRQTCLFGRRLIRDFEREAKIDNMSADELNYRKKLLVQELNSFIGLKKAYSSQLQQRRELMDGKSPSMPGGPSNEEIQGMMCLNLMYNFRTTSSSNSLHVDCFVHVTNAGSVLSSWFARNTYITSLMYECSHVKHTGCRARKKKYSRNRRVSFAVGTNCERHDWHWCPDSRNFADSRRPVS